MGLKPSAGPTPKAHLKEKFHNAFRTYDSLSEARDAVGGQRASTVVLVDGAVVCMAVPMQVVDFKSYAGVVWRSVRGAMSAGKIVIVTWDEPDSMTNAKRVEQARRDANKKKRKVVTCSEDFADVVAPPSADFTRDKLHSSNTIHAFKDHRPSKARFFDEIAIFLLNEANEAVSRWKKNGHDAGALLLDGVDLRGAECPAGERRLPQMAGTDEDLVRMFAREEHVGEGDLKLSQLEWRVRELVSAGKDRPVNADAPSESLAAVEATSLIIHSTIDTDSLAIGVIDVAKRRVAPMNGSAHAIICMRERAAKDAWASGGGGASYTTVDITLLESQLQEHMWGISCNPSPAELLSSALSFVAGTSICGCDFVELRGANFPHVLEALPSFVKTETRARNLLVKALMPEDCDALAAKCAIKTLCHSIAERLAESPRHKRQAGLVREVEEAVLRKTTWLLGYWAGRERVANEIWGFNMPPGR